MSAGKQGKSESQASAPERALGSPLSEPPIEVVTYGEAASVHVPLVSADSARAAFQDACSSSLKRREDVAQPGMHVGKSGGHISHTSLVGCMWASQQSHESHFSCELIGSWMSVAMANCEESS